MRSADHRPSMETISALLSGVVCLSRIANEVSFVPWAMLYEQTVATIEAAGMLCVSRRAELESVLPQALLCCLHNEIELLDLLAISSSIYLFNAWKCCQLFTGDLPEFLS